jgi:hypoxanthine phosphoribosyltransferase
MAAERTDIRCLFSAETIAKRVQELAVEITTAYANQPPPLLVGALKGSWIFMADLVRQISVPICCDFVKLSSYGAGSTTTGQIKMQLDMTLPTKGQHLLIVEDIIDTGLSTDWLIRHLRGKQPASLRVCALLDKPSRRRVPVHIDYLGFTIPDHFVVGYGIDWAEQHRELPYIGYIAEGDAPHGK